MITEIKSNDKLIDNLWERQISLEHYYDKKNTRKLLRSRFEEYFKDEPELQDNLVYDIMGILALRTKKTSVNAIVEMLASRLEIEESVTKIVEKIVLLIKKDILIGSIDKKNRTYVQWDYTLTEEDMKLIEQYQYKLPMICKPLPVNHKGNNKGCGYLVNGSTSLILNNYHKEDICTEVLDKLNTINFCINGSLVQTIEPEWSSMKDYLDEEQKSELEKQEYFENWERFKKSVSDATAVMINNGNSFYFCHKVDKRGRLYSLGYQLNYQSFSWHKAQLEFANKQLISDEVNFF